MTRKRRTTKEIELVKFQLADIIEDEFERDGQVVTHERLAARHVMRNSSTTAAEDVALYGGAAVAYLRRDKGYAIVPITAKVVEWESDPEDEKKILDAVAGLGAGGPRVGWYQPRDRDDWLWVYYIGFLARNGVKAVYWAGKQVEDNKQLNSSRTRGMIATRANAGVEVPAGAAERKVLTERIDAS